MIFFYLLFTGLYQFMLVGFFFTKYYFLFLGSVSIARSFKVSRLLHEEESMVPNLIHA